MPPAFRLVEPGGSGPTMVLVHGVEDSWASWRRLAGRLGPDWRVLALDLPWRPGNDYRWRYRGTAGDWIARGLDALDRPPDVLVGHSFGATGLLDVLSRPARPAPRAAVLAMPFYRPPELPASWEVLAGSRRAFDRIIAEGLRHRLGRRAATIDPEVRRLMLARMLDRIGLVGFLTLFEHFLASADVDLAAVRTPTLVLAGAHDPGLGGGRAQALAARMPAATVHIDQQYDHFCHVEQADVLAGQLTEFLRVTT